MKPLSLFPNNLCGSKGWKLFCGSGWLLAVILGIWGGARLYHRVILHYPPVQKKFWAQTLAEKERQFAPPWQDKRPLVIFAGDSHVEFGDWYDLFSGAYAVRNCGLASSEVADVIQLVGAIGDVHPQSVVLLCGFNDLSRQVNPDECLHRYENLLATVHSHLQPESIFVLSLMPLRESPVDLKTHRFNEALKQFNVRLAECSRQHLATFLDVTSAVMDARGGLANELTVDGLHLNPEGYRRVAAVIAPHLPAPSKS